MTCILGAKINLGIWAANVNNKIIHVRFCFQSNGCVPNVLQKVVYNINREWVLTGGLGLNDLLYLVDMKLLSHCIL